MSKLFGANGKPINADDRGRLLSRSTTQHEIADATTEGKCYSWTSTYTTAGGGEEVIYIKNDSQIDLVIHDFVAGTNANAVFTMAWVTGTPGGAGDITSVQRNSGSPLNASGTYAVTAKGNASVTGLTIGDTITAARVLASDSKNVSFDGSLIIAPGKAIAVTNSATSGFEITIAGHFNDLDK